MPEGAVLSPREGVAQWDDRGLRFVLMLHKDRSGQAPGGLDRKVFVSPLGQLGADPEDGGLNATLAVRSIPEVVGSLVGLENLREFVREASHFVADPRDLCWLLAQEDDVRRGSLYAWLFQGYAARLVKALVLARELGDRELIRVITDILHSGRQVPVSPVKNEDVLMQARRWAAQFSKDTGRKIEV